MRMRSVPQAFGTQYSVGDFYKSAKFISTTLSDQLVALPQSTERASHSSADPLNDLLSSPTLYDCFISETKASSAAIDGFRFERSSNLLFVFQMKFSDSERKDRSHRKAIPALIDFMNALKLKGSLSGSSRCLCSL